MIPVINMSLNEDLKGDANSQLCQANTLLFKKAKLKWFGPITLLCLIKWKWVDGAKSGGKWL
jgi:hypothetical protein